MSNVVGVTFLDTVIGRFSLADWRLRSVLTFLVGAMTVLALPPFFCWPVLFFSLPVFLLLFDREVAAESRSNGFFTQRHVRGLLLGWLFGFGYFIAGFYWMGHAFLVEADRFAVFMPLAVVALPAFLALFYALAVVPVFLVSGPYARFFALVSGLGVAEWLRGHVLTGLPWNAIGYGLTGDVGTLQLASLVGLYGLNFLTVLFFASPYLLIAGLRDGNGVRWHQFFAFSLLITLFCVSLFWGHFRALNAGRAGFVEGVKLRLVQPNVSQKKKMDLRYVSWNFKQLLEHSGSTQEAIRRSGVTHIIWPEVAVRILLDTNKHAQNEIAQMLPEGVTLFTGAIRLEGEGDKRKAFNSLLVFDDQAQVTSVYDKIHLVPFGEYLPLKSIASFIGFEHLTRQAGGFHAGNGPRWLEARGIPAFSPLICYEIVFPDAMYDEGRRPKWLLNVTNDAWFGNSTGPHQHFHMTRVRAVEEGLPAIRVANTGISGVIDAYGTVLMSLPFNQEGAIDYKLPKAIEETVYAQYRGVVFPFFLVFSLFLMLLASRQRM